MTGDLVEGYDYIYFDWNKDGELRNKLPIDVNLVDTISKYLENYMIMEKRVGTNINEDGLMSIDHESFTLDDEKCEMEVDLHNDYFLNIVINIKTGKMKIKTEQFIN